MGLPGRRQRPSQTEPQGPELAGVQALQAHDAFPAVPLLMGNHPGGANLHASPALDAISLGELQLHQGHPGKETVECAQGTENTAEGAADEGGQDDESDQNGDLVPEVKTQGGP